MIRRLNLRADIAKLAASSGAITISRMIAAFFGFITTVIVARAYGVEAAGLSSVFGSIIFVLSAIGSWGLGKLLLIELSKRLSKNEHEEALHFVKAGFQSTWLFWCVLFPLAAWLAFSRIEASTGMGATILILVGIALLGRILVMNYMNASQVALGIKRYCLIIIMNAFINMSAVASYLLFFEPNSIVPMVGITLTAATSGTISYLWVKRSIQKRMTGSPRDNETRPPSGRSILRKSTPFMMIDVAGIAMLQGSIVVASFFIPVTQLGVYSVADKIALMASFLFLSINIAATPMISKIHDAKSNEEILEFVHRAGRLIFWATTPLIIALIFSRDLLIGTFFGPKFADASLPLLILLTGQLATSFSGVVGAYMEVTGGKKVLAKISVATSALCLALVSILAPIWGMAGIATAVACSMITARLASLIYIRARDKTWLFLSPAKSGG